jgi:hypothetical protein
MSRRTPVAPMNVTPMNVTPAQSSKTLTLSRANLSSSFWRGCSSTVRSMSPRSANLRSLILSAQ